MGILSFFRDRRFNKLVEAAEISKPAPKATMLKMVNGMQYLPGDPVTQGWPGMRDFIKAGGAQGVVLWAPHWADLQPDAKTWDESKFAELDSAIAAARADGKVIYLAVAASTPDWACVKHAARVGKNTGRLTADDLSIEGPWATMICKLLLRYRGKLRAIIPLNEPNLGYLDDPKTMASHTAVMIKTAAKVIWATDKSVRMLVPATADQPHGSGLAAYDVFTSAVLQALKGWRPPTGLLIGWAHHGYNDVKRGRPKSGRPYVHIVLDLLDHYLWPGGRQIWLTEIGYVFDTHMTSTQWKYDYDQPLEPQEVDQLANVVSHYKWCKNLDSKIGKVNCWANYTVYDWPWGGGGFLSGLFRLDGTPHPLHDQWLKL